MYKAFVDSKIEEYLTRGKSTYSEIKVGEELATTVEAAYDQVDEAKKLIQRVSSFPPTQPVINVSEYIDKYYAPKLEEYNRRLEAIEQKKELAIKELQDARDAEVTAATQRANADVYPIKEKHAELMSYKDTIEGICARYGISINEIQIDPNLSASEYETLLDAAIIGCKHFKTQQSTKYNPLNLLYKPLDWEGKPVKRLLAIMGFSIGMHWFGGIVAVILFIFMYISTIGIYKKLDKIKIAQSMMYTPDFDKFLDLKEVNNIPAVDTTAVEQEYSDNIASLVVDDPNVEYSAVKQQYAADAVEINNRMTNAFDEVKGIYNKLLTDAQEWYNKACENKQRLIDESPKFGDSMLSETPHSYGTYKYVLGIYCETIEQAVDVPSENIGFLSTADNMLDFMKLMIANRFLDVKEKKFSVHFVDPHGMGKDFAEFLSQDKTLHEYIEVITKSPDEVLRNLTDLVTDNIKKCGQLTADELNKKNEEAGMVTLNTHLYVLHSGNPEWAKKPELKELLANSWKAGVQIWIYDSVLPEGIYHFNKAFDLPGITAPHPYSYELGERCTKALAAAVENSKDGSIDYYTSIADKYIPREKWGTWSTNKGIELNFGLADGDPNKGYPMVLGDANVHLLMGGQSGAGKSAAINQMLLSLLTKYNPRELMLVMIDFKNVEFSTFTDPDPDSDGKISIIPHARIMAGTKDGEYALSVFDFLIDEMERRQRLFGEVNQKKLEDYNNLMTEQGTPEKRLPRILLLIDEFQVMFTEVDGKIVDKIQDRIRSLAKLARAFGCHMWFTSQSMKGTMSDDVKANFSMRAALRCTKDVSTELIGNDASGTIKEKFGYLYTNDSTGQDPTRNTLWRVPFVSTKNILKTMREAAELYKSQGMEGYKAPFYDEKQMHKCEEMFEWYEAHKDNPKVNNPALVLLGERTMFSTNPAPINFYMNDGDNQNLLIAGSEDADLLNLCRTIMDNCELHGTKYIFHCADEDSWILLDSENRFRGKALEWSKPNLPSNKWTSDESPIKRLIDYRKANPDEPREPVYFIGYQWDKYQGIGLSQGRAYTTIEAWLRDAPALGIHFVIFIKTKGEFYGSFFSKFNHKIVTFCSEDLSYKIIDSPVGNKLPSEGGFGAYLRGNDLQKFKIYQHEFTRVLSDKELKL